MVTQQWASNCAVIARPTAKGPGRGQPRYCQHAQAAQSGALAAAWPVQRAWRPKRGPPPPTLTPGMTDPSLWASTTTLVETPVASITASPGLRVQQAWAACLHGNMTGALSMTIFYNNCECCVSSQFSHVFSATEPAVCSAATVGVSVYRRRYSCRPPSPSAHMYQACVAACGPGCLIA